MSADRWEDPAYRDFVRGEAHRGERRLHPKVAASTSAGSATLGLVVLAGLLHVHLTAPEAGALVALFTFVAGFLKGSDGR